MIKLISCVHSSPGVPGPNSSCSIGNSEVRAPSVLSLFRLQRVVPRFAVLMGSDI